MLEMRDALTAEVAEKHDIIVSLKHDVQRLEEQCHQLNKHAQFKDDIIKELRREVKQLRQASGSFHKTIYFVLSKQIGALKTNCGNWKHGL